MKPEKNTRFKLLLASLGAASVLAALISLCMGRYPLPVSTLADIIYSAVSGAEPAATEAQQNVVWLIRLPRVIAALLVGSSLAVSGATYQSIFKNPLAAPELLGVFQGSCVGAAVAILIGFGLIPMQFCALLGGISAVALTTLIARFFKSDSTAILVLSGVIVTGLMGSILGLLKYSMDVDTQLPAITYWQMGSLANLTMGKVYLIAPAMLISMAVLLSMRWQFNLLSLGDAEARSLGVNLFLIRGLAVICSTLLTSCAVCLSGTVAWVGLIIPHLARLITGPDNVKLAPVSIFIGALFLLVIDTMGGPFQA